MGKALLFIVAAIGATSLQTIVQANSVQNRSAVQQVVYQDDMIAYQAARAGYNVAYAMIHEAPSLAEGVARVNNVATGLRGEYLGGDYRVTAGFVGGETVTIQSNGYYGGRWDGGRYVGRYVSGRYLAPSHHFIGDDRQSVVFNADRSDGRPRRLTGQFLQSRAGYCSAIFVQRYLPDTAPADQPAPEMLFEPGNTRDGEAAAFDLVIMPGTQMNFFIAVDQGCNVRPNTRKDTGRTAAQRLAYVAEFNQIGRVNKGAVQAYLGQFNHLHYALDLNVADLANLRESPWAMIEQHRDGGERWRIGWEDIHNTSWLTGKTPRTSLRLTKETGYLGTGWNDLRVTDDWWPANVNPALPDGYRDLEDYGDRPDFSDQVMEINMTPINDSPLAVTVPPRPPVTMPALVATNGGCPALKTPMDRPSTRDVGRTDRICVEASRVDVYLAAGSVRAAITPPTTNTRVTICHSGKTKSVTQNQLAKHLNHGDVQGACSAPAGSGSAGGSSSETDQG